MNDPHVNTLYYRIIPGTYVDYKKAPSITEDTNEFQMCIEGDIAEFNMKVHCSTEEEAIKIVGQYLQKWEILIGLEHNPDDLKLVFQRANIVDQAPQEDNGKNLKINVFDTVHLTCSVDAVLHRAYPSYPSRPKKFLVSPDVETMYVRYKAYKQRRESLNSMAYMCLTVLEASAGGRNKAANQYFIDEIILDTLGKLCSTKGDIVEARKAPKYGTYKPLNQEEKTWIESVIRALILRVGEWAYDPNANLRKLTMIDFPSITS